MNIAMIAAGYKADMLFENVLAYRDICDKGEKRIEYLKESHIINDFIGGGLIWTLQGSSFII